MSKNRKDQTSTPSPRAPLTVGKKIAFGLIAASLFFLVLEGGLWLAGTQPISQQTDLDIGFAGHSPLFVPTSNPKIRTTAKTKLPWFNEQTFAAEKPNGIYRVFCLGGSTTYGRPYSDETSFCGWMRAFLNAQNEQQQFEVINAGGISYASYRVTRVLEEILQYSPDLVVIYTGHNEFLEERTYRSIREVSPLRRSLESTLSKTRLYSLAKSIVSKNEQTPVDASELLPDEVKTRLDSGIGPDAFQRKDQRPSEVREQLAFNLNRMIELADNAGCKVLLVQPGSNLKDCSPFKSEVDADLPAADSNRVRELLLAAQASLQNQEFADSETSAREVIELDPRCAAGHFLLGKSLVGLRRHRDALDAFIAARDHDVCTLRATSELRRTVRRISDEKNVPRIDFENLAAQQCKNMIPSEQLFLDHVHPTVEGHRLLAISIIGLLAEKKLIPYTTKPTEPTIQRVTQNIVNRIDQQTHGDALRNLSKVFRWAGKSEEADRMAIRANDLLADDPNVLYLAGNALLGNGDVDGAMAKLQESIRLDPNHAPAWVSLGVAMQQNGQAEKAFESFQKAHSLDANNLMARNNLASIYVARQEWAKAENHLLQAIQIDPRYAKAHQNLGVVFAKQKKWKPAIESLKQATLIAPNDPQPHISMAEIYRTQKQIAKTVSHYRRALQLQPSLERIANTLAWILATHEDDTIRNGKEALALAKECAARTNYKNPSVFTTLAAAHAENGNFSEAVDWQQKAVVAAPSNLKQACEDRLRMYKLQRSVRTSY